MISNNVIDLKDEGSRITYIVSVVAVMSVLSTLAVVLRIFTRLRILHIYGADDAVMVVAQVMTLGSAVATFAESAFGLGQHQSAMPLEHRIPYMKSYYSSIVIYNVATCIVKISILLQYRRIFTGPSMQKLTMFGLIFEGSWALTLSILLPLVCNPVSAFWDIGTKGQCLNQLAIWYAMASVNLVTDFFIFSLPLPVIRSLQLPNRQKFMLMGVFCLGFFTCIVSIYRITTLSAAANSTDPTWENTDAAVWSFVELSVGVFAACLPTLKPLFALILPRLFNSTFSSRTNQYPGYGSAKVHTHGTSSWRRSKMMATPPFKNGTGGLFVRDTDSDMDALKKSGSFTPEAPGTDVEMMGYNVTVTGGSRQEENHVQPKHIPKAMVGIQTTTVLTQRVDSL